MTKKQNDPRWHEQQAAECRKRARSIGLSDDDLDCGLSYRVRRVWHRLAKIHENEAAKLTAKQKENATNE